MYMRRWPGTVDDPKLSSSLYFLFVINLITRSKKICRLGRSLKNCGTIHYDNDKGRAPISYLPHVVLVRLYTRHQSWIWYVISMERVVCFRWVTKHIFVIVIVRNNIMSDEWIPVEDVRLRPKYFNLCCIAIMSSRILEKYGVNAAYLSGGYTKKR